MQRIAVAAQSADSEALVVQLLLEFLQFLLVIEHRELAMRVAGIVAGAEFDSVDVQALQFFKDLVERELRQKRCNTPTLIGLIPFCDLLSRTQLIM